MYLTAEIRTFVNKASPPHPPTPLPRVSHPLQSLVTEGARQCCLPTTCAAIFPCAMIADADQATLPIQCYLPTRKPCSDRSAEEGMKLFPIACPRRWHAGLCVQMLSVECCVCTSLILSSRTHRHAAVAGTSCLVNTVARRVARIHTQRRMHSFSQMLEWSPRRRFSAQQTLAHGCAPYCSEINYCKAHICSVPRFLQLHDASRPKACSTDSLL